MFKFFLGCLSVVAIALFVNKAIAENDESGYISGVVISETITPSSPGDTDMQPLPEDEGVMVAPTQSSSSMVPVLEEDDTVVIESDN